MSRSTCHLPPTFRSIVYFRFPTPCYLPILHFDPIYGVTFCTLMFLSSNKLQ
jgi:hypothetical protein